jgi:hypothetical protein
MLAADADAIESGPVRRVLKSIASALLAILLATVLAPSFGWEASAAQASHADEVSAPSDARNHERHDATDHESGISHHHHGCAGHMFGHLFVTLDEAAGLVVPDAGEAMLPEHLPGVLSSFPKRLDRPPHAPRLA